jgi:hypothetical protein
MCFSGLSTFVDEVTETSWREEVEQAEYDRAHEVVE